MSSWPSGSYLCCLPGSIVYSQQPASLQERSKPITQQTCHSLPRSPVYSHGNNRATLTPPRCAFLIGYEWKNYDIADNCRRTAIWGYFIGIDDGEKCCLMVLLQPPWGREQLSQPHNGTPKAPCWYCSIATSHHNALNPVFHLEEASYAYSCCIITWVWGYCSEMSQMVVCLPWGRKQPGCWERKVNWWPQWNMKQYWMVKEY